MNGVVIMPGIENFGVAGRLGEEVDERGNRHSIFKTISLGKEKTIKTFLTAEAAEKRRGIPKEFVLVSEEIKTVLLCASQRPLRLKGL
jgi:hypothetical protein